MLKAPELPNLYFVKSGNYTYARMYRNAWQNKKKDSEYAFHRICDMLVLSKLDIKDVTKTAQALTMSTK